MNREDLTEKLLDIERERGWPWKFICGEIYEYHGATQGTPEYGFRQD